MLLKAHSCLEKLSGRLLKVGRVLSASMSCQALMESQFGAGFGAWCWGRPPDNKYCHSACTHRHSYTNQDISLLYYFFLTTNTKKDMTTQRWMFICFITAQSNKAGFIVEEILSLLKAAWVIKIKRKWRQNSLNELVLNVLVWSLINICRKYLLVGKKESEIKKEKRLRWRRDI